MNGRIRSLGGSGEDSRSCFLLSWGDTHILLDCGVRRELHVPVGVCYPALTPQIATSLKAVFLSHAHEDHTAALPYLYELGYRGPIYATAETLAVIKSFLRKWVDYVSAGGGSLPFQQENIDRLDFCPFGLGYHELDGIRILSGRSGHMLGSCWYQFDFGDRQVLYTGDLAVDGFLLPSDPLPTSETVILECAYAGRRLDQAEQYVRLAASVRDTLSAGGKVVLPVPANGRGCDLYLYLKSLGIPLCVEKSVRAAAEGLRRNAAWIREDAPWAAMDDTEHIPENDEARKEIARQSRAVAILTPDGMLTSSAALCYYEALRGDAKNKFILTGHTAAGTVGDAIFQPEFRVKNGVRAQAERITIKVHPDEADALALVQSCNAQQVMLFHAGAVSCGSLQRALFYQGIKTCCGTKPEDCLTI